MNFSARPQARASSSLSVAGANQRMLSTAARAWLASWQRAHCPGPVRSGRLPRIRSTSIAWHSRHSSMPCVWCRNAERVRDAKPAMRSSLPAANSTASAPVP